MVQVNNSFSGQNYLPLSLGFLVSYAEFHCKNYDDFEFLNPLYKRVPIKDVDGNLLFTSMMEANAYMPDGEYRFA